MTPNQEALLNLLEEGSLARTLAGLLCDLPAAEWQERIATEIASRIDARVAEDDEDALGEA